MENGMHTYIYTYELRIQSVSEAWSLTHHSVREEMNKVNNRPRSEHLMKVKTSEIK
jgi:hypothetical protein